MILTGPLGRTVKQLFNIKLPEQLFPYQCIQFEVIRKTCP